MTSIERQRQKDDLLYHMITNSEATTLNDVCMKISEHLISKYSQSNMSTRFKLILNKVCTSNDRVAKHALVFFALCREKEIQNIFMAGTPRVPPQKFTYFTEQDLPKLLEKLAKGAFTSLRAFVEDSRWTYTTL
tara:strand:- start:500 stop:901 length:402 start_codon:yes stop_codon:yes gene_type:complete